MARAASSTSIASSPAILPRCADERLGVDAPQVETLAARQHRDRHLADFGGGEDELDVRRRLFQRLQQAVEGLRGQHVHLVDDVDLVAGRDGRVAHPLDDLANVVDAGVRGGVHLDHVDMPALHDRLAMLAGHGKVDRRLVDRFGLVVRARARMRAVVVLPTPRTPVSIQAWAMRPLEKALVRVRTIGSWPIRRGKVGRTVFAGEHAIGAGLSRLLEFRLRSFEGSSPLAALRGRFSARVSPVRQRSVNAVTAGRSFCGGREAGTMTRSVLVRAASFRT